MLLLKCAKEPDLPDGCANLIIHDPSAGTQITTALIGHPLVKTNFTGITRVGSIVASTAGRYLKSVLMDLGGKANAV